MRMRYDPLGQHDPEAGADGSSSPRWNLDEDDEHVHRGQRAPWLRAFVLGASDGLVSVAALMMGVSAGTDDLKFLRLSGVAGLVSGALSMALGEYVSVATQRDAEEADINLEIQEQLKGPEARARELEELAQIYVGRGLPYDLAKQVAVTLTEKDVIEAHARDELGIDTNDLANPMQAAIISAFTFSTGAALPLLSSAFLNDRIHRIIATIVSTTIGLLIFGILGAWLGGAALWRGGLRVLFGGTLALGVSYSIGQLFEVPPA